MDSGETKHWLRSCLSGYCRLKLNSYVQFICNPLQVYVTDVNDHRPLINIAALSPVEGRATTPEAAPVGSFVAHVTVSDADAGANGRVSCRLDGQDSNLFRLQPVSTMQVTIIIIIVVIVVVVVFVIMVSHHHMFYSASSCVFLNNYSNGLVYCPNRHV